MFTAVLLIQKKNYTNTKHCGSFLIIFSFLAIIFVNISISLPFYSFFLREKLVRAWCILQGPAK